MFTPIPGNFMQFKYSQCSSLPKVVAIHVATKFYTFYNNVLSFGSSTEVVLNC